jgi:glycosyltransferase involved in cell wall biosynthesis
MGTVTTDSIGIIIPAYNPDITTLKQFIREVRDELAPEIIRVEIDIPRQTHINQIEEAADVVSVATTRRGKGGAVMDGFDALETDILTFADADGSVPAESVDDVVQQIREGRADVSLASRRHPSSNIVSHQTIVRRLLGDVFALVARMMLPTQCRDYQCGAKAVRDDAWEAIGHHCYESGFAWDLEFVSVAGSLGHDIMEVPVEWEDHPDSTVDPLSTSLELATALIDVKRRTDAIAMSPRHRNTTPTEHSTLTEATGEDGD